jgi:hypothetical protein
MEISLQQSSSCNISFGRRYFLTDRAKQARLPSVSVTPNACQKIRIAERANHPFELSRNPQRSWLETAQRRYRELVEGKVEGVPGPLVFERLAARLGLDKPDSSLDAAWTKEAEDRLAAYRAGDLEAVDADQDFRELAKRT